MILKNFKFLYYYFLILSGIIILGVLIYLRFLRERLPKVIPFEFTEWKFWACFFIFLNYLFSIVFLIRVIRVSKKKGVKNDNNYESLKTLIDLVYKPLIAVDHLWKNIKNFQDSLLRIHGILLQFLKTRRDFFIIGFIFIFKVMPRLILAAVFYRDVFVFSTLEIVYKFIFIGIVSLLYKYFLYSIKDVVENYREKIEENYGPVSLCEVNSTEDFKDDKVLTIKQYIDFKYNTMLKNDITITEGGYTFNTLKQYGVEVETKKHYYEDFKKKKNLADGVLSDEYYKEIRLEYDSLFEKIMDTKFVLLRIGGLEIKYFKYIYLVVFFIYLISWIYLIYTGYFNSNLTFKQTFLILEKFLKSFEL